MNYNELKVLEIVKTFSGECSSVPAGTKILLVRLAGCNLACPYCDTPKSRDIKNEKAQTYTVDGLVTEIQKQIWEQGIYTILFTGGEPMLHEQQLSAVLARLAEPNFYALNYIIETNGSCFPSGDFYLAHCSKIMWCVDIKAFALKDSPAYGNEIAKFLFKADSVEAYELSGSVLFKIPVTSIADYNTVNIFLRETVKIVPPLLQNKVYTRFMYSPVFSEMSKADGALFIEQLSTNLIDFPPFTRTPILAGSETGINFQMHKTWGFR
jgi:organic radical activating enzyme